MYYNTLLTAKTYNIFISHSWAYGDAYDKLTSLLKQKPNFYFNDYSVPKDNPIHYAPTDYQLFQAIQERVNNSEVVLVMAGVYSTYSKWINLEIKAAKGQSGFFGISKPIIAVEPWGSEKTSQVVKDNATEIVKWNSDSITNAIRRWAP